VLRRLYQVFQSLFLSPMVVVPVFLLEINRLVSFAKITICCCTIIYLFLLVWQIFYERLRTARDLCTNDLYAE
jgi:uncharacterized membrane protein YGL010W